MRVTGLSVACVAVAAARVVPYCIKLSLYPLCVTAKVEMKPVHIPGEEIGLIC